MSTPNIHEAVELLNALIKLKLERIKDYSQSSNPLADRVLQKLASVDKTEVALLEHIKATLGER